MKSVFLIEKQEMLLKMVKLTLKEDGIDVFTTSDWDILYMIEDMKPDIVLLDLKIHKESEGQFLSEYLDNDVTKAIPLVGLGYPEEIEELEDKDVFSKFLTKPVSPLDLKDKLT